MTAARKTRLSARRFELLPVDEHSCIVVVMMDGNRVRSQLIRQQLRVDVEQFPVLVNLLNTHFTGISTEEIDRWVYEETLRLGGIPAPLNYQGFPKSVCTSLNDQVCHGIPSKDVILKEGDILNVDVSTIFNGFYSDSSRMFMMGEVSPQRQKLVRITKESVEEGLKQVKPWSRLGNVGYAVHQHACRNGCSVVREVGGHGIGLEFHEEPFVSFVSHRNSGEVLVPGMVFTIEPMVNSGSAHVYVDDADGWTIYTADGSDSAQWEVQVLVTETGYEVLAW
jgi:methionyl aminopeptidase